MGRRKRSSNQGASVPREQIQDWDTANPTRPSAICLYCYWDGKFYCVTFAALWVAKRFIEDLAEAASAEDYTWIKRKTESGYVIRHGISFENGLRIEGDAKETLDQALEMKLSDEQESWEFPSPYPEQIRQFIFGSSPVEKDREDKPRRQKAERPERKPRADKTGLVTANEIAEQMGVPGRDLRAVLRAKMEKPEVGWAFPPDQVESIKKLVKENLK